MLPTTHQQPTSLSTEQINDFASKEQQAALASGDEAKIREANDRALAEALLASLGTASSATAPKETDAEDGVSVPVKPGRPRPRSDALQVSVRYSPSETEYEASRTQTIQLRSWLDHHGFDVIPNSGGKSSNCLLISLMQHATGNYASEHTAEVRELREALVKSSKGAESGSLFGDSSSDSSLPWLVDQINEHYAVTGRKLTVWMASAFIDGQPSFLKIGHGELPAMIFESNSHFEAAVPRGTAKR